MLNKDNKELNLYFQNLKGLLIFLVVFGHFIEKVYLLNIPLIKTIYSFIYIFHMPLFVLISGYFSKKTNLKKIINLLITYLIFQVFVYPIGLSLFSGNAINIDLSFNRILNPRYTYWYLISLIIWRVVTPKLPKSKIILIILVAISIIPSITPNIKWATLSLGRTLSFYPFFYLGYLVDRKQFDKIFLNIPKKVSFIGLSIIILFCNIIFEKNNIPKELLYKKDYLLDYLPNIYEVIFLNILMFILTIFALKFICSLVKSDKCILTKWGDNTILIYLIHGFLFKSINLGLDLVSPMSNILLALLVSYGLCELLSTKWAKKYIGFLTRLKVR